MNNEKLLDAIKILDCTEYRLTVLRDTLSSLVQNKESNGGLQWKKRNVGDEYALTKRKNMKFVLESISHSEFNEYNLELWLNLNIIFQGYYLTKQLAKAKAEEIATALELI